MVVIKDKKKKDDNIKAMLGEWNDSNSSSNHYMDMWPRL